MGERDAQPYHSHNPHARKGPIDQHGPAVHQVKEHHARAVLLNVLRGRRYSQHNREYAAEYVRNPAASRNVRQASCFAGEEIVKGQVSSIEDRHL